MAGKRSVTAAAVAAVLVFPAGAYAQQQYQQWQQQQRQGQQQQFQTGQGIEQQVRSFLQQAEQNITRAVQQGDKSSIRQWTQNHLADSASVAMIMQKTGSGRTPIGFQATVADKQELMRRQAVAMSMMPELLNMVQNYDLSIRVLDIEPIGDNAAMVKTRISESGTINLQQQGVAQLQDRQGSQSGGQQGAAWGQQGQNGQTAAMGRGGGDQGFQQRSGFQQQQGFGQQQQQQQQRGQLSFNGIADCTHLIHRDQDGNRLVVGMANCSAEMSF